jgi:hypothetical protein
MKNGQKYGMHLLHNIFLNKIERKKRIGSKNRSLFNYILTTKVSQTCIIKSNLIKLIQKTRMFDYIHYHKKKRKY